MTDTILIERRVKGFISDARSNPRVWSGILRTLRLYPEQGIHVRCVFEATKAQLTETVQMESTEPRVVSPKLITVTRFTESARKIIAAELRYTID